MVAESVTGVATPAWISARMLAICWLGSCAVVADTKFEVPEVLPAASFDWMAERCGGEQEGARGWSGVATKSSALPGGRGASWPSPLAVGKSASVSVEQTRFTL